MKIMCRKCKQSRHKKYVGQRVAYHKWRVGPAVRLHAPHPVRGRLGLADGLDPFPYLLFGQPGSAVPVGVESVAHVADLVTALLERGDPATNEGHHQVISCQALALEPGDSQMLAVHYWVEVPRIVCPVRFPRWGANLELRQFDLVDIGGVLDIKEGPKPLLARF